MSEPHMDINIQCATFQYKSNYNCPRTEESCTKDSEGFEAISYLHSLIDDDKNGELDRSESEDFFREDLHHDSVVQTYHENDDHITVLDLWHFWFNSGVYNWSTEDVVNWLNLYVELPQYTKNFVDNKVDGRSIPKLAANIQSLATVLGIKNAVHKQKLSIKSTDLVLFGPPKNTHNFKKDVAVIISLLVGLGGCYFAYRQQKLAHVQMQKVMKDLSSLQNAEDALIQVQNELEKAQMEQRTIADDKQNLERKLKEEIRHAKAEAEQLKMLKGSPDSCAELKALEDELMKVKLALYEAERRLEENQCIPLFELQIWLQLTYEVEKRYFESKREAAQNQLLAARQMWDKIRKQKSKFLGSIRVAHTTSLDETDQQIMHVRNALDIVKVELQERMTRWHEIEKLCHFSISTNPGIETLYSIIKSEKFNSFVRSAVMSSDDLTDPTKLKMMSAACLEEKSKMRSSNSSLSGSVKDNSSDGGNSNSKVFFQLGSSDMQSLNGSTLSNSNLSLDTNMVKSKSFVDGPTKLLTEIKKSSINSNDQHLLHYQYPSSRQLLVDDLNSNQPILPKVSSMKPIASLKDDGNSSDSSIHCSEGTEGGAKNRKHKLLAAFKH
ncbi:hypothetical protein HELRODRAFT_189915 [Helobdella robusta]|uniref:SAM domain-containing protein n=1 Tax=Helobdella robusta TaxID=6412 RepID=T1FRH4_HELRO|nr:hypothetical protein HELRODRAFT_189915 [Helobdella robusta]ESN90607.1 hypothetical protein HELRODRAFT_189915 [Helobdella robusta]